MNTRTFLRISALILTVHFFSTGCLYAQTDDLKRLELKGKIKSVTESDCSFSFKNGKVEIKDVLSKITYCFSEQGYIKDKKVYNSKNTCTERTTYSYNQSGKVIEKVDSNAAYPQKMKEVCSYDSLGRLREDIWYKSDNSIKYKNTYSYDTMGREIQRLAYEGKDLRSKTLIIYSNNGLSSVETTYSGNGDFWGKSENTYDSKGHMTSTKKYDENYKLKHNYAFSYDDNGNLLKFEDIDDYDDLFGFEINKYDSLNRKTEMYEMTSWDGQKSVHYYGYDEIGNLLYDKPDQYISYNNKSYTYEYVYDSNGNWTQKIVYTDSSPTTVTKREITYY